MLKRSDDLELAKRLRGDRDASALDRDAADAIERLGNALHEMLTNGRWTEGEQRGEWAVSPEVYEIGAMAEIGIPTTQLK